jgi:hypothetical protein
MSGSLWSRLKRIEAKRGLAEEPPWEQACSECGLLVGRIIFEDATKDPPTFDSAPPCPTCVRLRAELPESAPINHIIVEPN